MAVKYVKDFEFPSHAGYAKGGEAKGHKGPGLMVMIGVGKKPAEKAKGGGNWIQDAIKKPGALHKQLGVPAGEKIPAKKLHAAAEKGGKLGQRARLAETLKGMHKAKGGMAHDDEAADKSLIKKMVKSDALKKADGGGVKARGLFEGSRQTDPSMSSTMPKKGGGVVKKADGGGIGMQSPLQDMAMRQRMARAVPVAPRAPVIAAPAAAMQAAPAGGPRIGVNAPRAGGPNVGAIRAAMARRASQAMPENAPGMMKKGGKVKC